MSKRTPAPAGGDPAATASTETAVSPAATVPAIDPVDATALADVDPAELVEARALIAFGEHAANDIVGGSADAIATLVADGLVDDDPAAVDYAKSLLDG